jgi:uncharacterized RDD family membrane protein YckC
MTTWDSSSSEISQVGLPYATPLHRFGAALLESALAIVTLGIGWFIWWLILISKGLTPARQILGLRIINANTMQPVSNSQVFLRGFVVYFLAFSALASALSLVLFGAGWLFTLVSALLVFRASHQTLWDQMTGTTVGFQKK